MLIGLRNLEGNLFDEFRRMQQEMDEVFASGRWPTGIRTTTEGSFPPINVGSTPERVDVYIYASGLDSESLDISIQHNLLTIIGERGLIAEEGADYYRKERFDGGFKRVITLPDDVDSEKVEAQYRDGVLHVVVPRKEASRPRQIPVS